jgi:lysozyme
MRINTAGLDLIKEFEGCKLQAYYDAVGRPTIGYGHTGEDVYIGKEITQLEANNLLYSDIREFEAQIALLIEHEVNDNQFSALVCFAYNLGANTLKHSTLLAKVNEGDFTAAADEFPKWTHAGGVELEGLVRRRAAERELFLKISEVA